MKKENTACSTISEYYGSYTSLVDAKRACENDENCGKVYDSGCNDVSFKLCKKDEEQVASNEGSCLYVHDCDNSGIVES
jgi:hypothetical protein